MSTSLDSQDARRTVALRNIKQNFFKIKFVCVSKVPRFKLFNIQPTNMSITHTARFCLVYWVDSGTYTVQFSEYVDNADMLWDNSIIGMVPFAIRDNHAEWTRYSARILAISGEYNVRNC